MAAALEANACETEKFSRPAADFGQPPPVRITLEPKGERQEAAGKVDCKPAKPGRAQRQGDRCQWKAAYSAGS